MAAVPTESSGSARRAFSACCTRSKRTEKNRRHDARACAVDGCGGLSRASRLWHRRGMHITRTETAIWALITFALMSQGSALTVLPVVLVAIAVRGVVGVVVDVFRGR